MINNMTTTVENKIEKVEKVKKVKKVKVTATPYVVVETDDIATKVVADKASAVVKSVADKPAVAKAIADKAPTKKFGTRYIEAVGRRKTSTARVRITEAAKSSIIVNGKEVPAYFATAELQKIVVEAFEKSKVAGKFVMTVLVRGGGIHSQAEALRHGLSRALVAYDLELRTRLKKMGFLKRDPRMKERRKFGLKKARKAPQWSKR